MKESAKKLRSAPWIVCCLALWLASAPPALAESCREPERLLQRALDAEEGPEKVELYDAARSRAEVLDCPFAAARAHAGLAFFAGIVRSRLALALDHVERSRERLAAWRSRVDADEQPTRSEVEDLELTQENHALKALFRLGWLDEARQQLDRLRQLHRRAETVAPEKSVNLGIDASRILRRLGETDRARQALLEVEPLLDGLHVGYAAFWHHERGWIDDANGELAAARSRFEKAYAFDTSQEQKVHFAVDLAGVVLRLGKPEEAAKYIGEAAELASGNDDLHLNAHLRFVRARILRGLGDHGGASRMADASLDLLDAARDHWADLGLSYFSSRDRYLRLRFELALASRDPLELWQVFERRQARLLLHELEARGASGKLDRGASPAREELGVVQKELLASLWQLEQADPALEAEKRRRLEAQLSDVRRRLRDVQARLALARGRRAAPSSLDPAEAAELLGEHTLGLLFVAGSESHGLLVLEPSGQLDQPVDAVSAGEIERLTTQLIRAWRRPGRDDAERAVAERLSRLLFAGLGDRLERFERLAVVASGPLEGFPLDALPHPRTGRPLVHSHEVAYQPSFSVLGRLREDSCRPPRPWILALGDAIFGASDPRWPAALESPRGRHEDDFLRRLEASSDEIADIRRHFGDSSTLLAGRSATRRLFLEEAPRHRFLHLATHAITDVERADRSRLALSCLDEAGRAVRDCDLFVPAIAELELCRQTVVLSACSSASGQRVVGEGVLGLPRSFLEVGASTVVATAWLVEDAAAAKLMKTFYGFLRAGFPTGDALRQARRLHAGAGAPPAEWAPFLLIGDWRSTIIENAR